MRVRIAVEFDVPEHDVEEITYAVMTILGAAVPYMADNVDIMQEEAS